MQTCLFSYHLPPFLPQGDRSVRHVLLWRISVEECLATNLHTSLKPCRCRWVNGCDAVCWMVSAALCCGGPYGCRAWGCTLTLSAPGYRKVHRFSLQDCEIMHAVFEGEGASRLSCAPVQISQLLEHIHGTAEVAVGASHDVLTVRSFHHPVSVRILLSRGYCEFAYVSFIRVECAQRCSSWEAISWQIDMCLICLPGVDSRSALSSFMLSQGVRVTFHAFDITRACSAICCNLISLQLTGAAERAVLKTEMSISTAEFDTYR